MIIGERGEDVVDEKGGKKLRDCCKNPRAKPLALHALRISDGFIGTRILECNDIYADIKKEETGVSEISTLSVLVLY